MAVNNALREFRLIVVSPSDVRDYKDAVDKVVAELNRAEFQRRGVVVTIWRWDADAIPQMSALGVQDALDQQMDLERSRLVVGIFWTRIGTQGPDQKTGTEHEIERAFDFWQRTGQPTVALYFCTQPLHPPNTVEDADQLVGLLRFKSSLEMRQIIFEVKDLEEFEARFRHHLLSKVRDFIEGKGSQPQQPTGRDSIRSIAQFRPPQDFFATSMFEGELERARRSGSFPFWRDREADTLWMGNLFAFWVKIPGVPARSVAISVADTTAIALAFETRAGEPQQPRDVPERQRAVFVRMSGFSSEGAPTLHVTPIRLATMRYVAVNWEELIQRDSRYSAFGIVGFEPIPSITVAHCLIVADDGWMVLARRSAGQKYYPRAWSASFEKHVLLNPLSRSTPSAHETIFDTIADGLAEEFGLTPSDLRSAEVVAVGRECVLEPTGLVMNVAVICSVSVRLTLEQIWAALENSRSRASRTENDAWVGLRADDPRRLAEIVAASRLGNFLTPSHLAGLPGVELDVFPASLPEAREGILLWHPTSLARLALCGAIMREAK
jgi:hypothetical protein